MSFNVDHSKHSRHTKEENTLLFVVVARDQVRSPRQQRMRIHDVLLSQGKRRADAGEERPLHDAGRTAGIVRHGLRESSSREVGERALCSTR